MLLVVAECHLKVRNELRHGHYDWFRPVYGTNIQNEMIRANKDLQTFVDSGSIMRTANHRFRKDGKIFTFQANEPITTWISKNERIYESINHKGRPFVEYNFGNTKEPTSLAPVWVKNNPNRYRTYCYDDYEQYVKAPNILIKDTFHFMILGKL